MQAKLCNMVSDESESVQRRRRRAIHTPAFTTSLGLQQGSVSSWLKQQGRNAPQHVSRCPAQKALLLLSVNHEGRMLVAPDSSIWMQVSAPFTRPTVSQGSSDTSGEAVNALIAAPHVPHRYRCSTE